MAASEGTLGLLHEAVATALMERIAAGEATASDISNAIKMLKDNNITCTPSDDNELGELETLLTGKPVGKATQADLDAALDAAEFSTSRVN